MQVKMNKLNRQIQKDKDEGVYSEEKEREMMMQMTEDMKPIMINTLWYLNKMDITQTTTEVLKKLLKGDAPHEKKKK